MFGRMFGDLEPLNQQTNEELKLIARVGMGEVPGMQEVAAIDNPKGTAAGITFFGQFIDHDLTLDTAPQPDAPVDVNTLVNGRTFAFDLDSVYGGGPQQSPQLYDGDKFKIGVATDGVSPDLPRNPDGKIGNQDIAAILVEHRNDENLIIAQIHLSFLRLHNTLVDQGMSFDEAHDTVVNAYRYVVLNDYLPQIVGEDAVEAALKQPVNNGFYQPGTDTPFTPVEFAVAAFRFGHSQVRNVYAINDESGGVPVFSFNPDPLVGDLSGGRQLPANRIIDFDNFFSELPREVDDAPALIGRAIDTQISQSLFQLPIPGAEGGGDNVLAFRNLLRAKFYDMPSGEAVAEAMGIPETDHPRPGELLRRHAAVVLHPARSRSDIRWGRTGSGRWPDRGGGVCRPAPGGRRCQQGPRAERCRTYRAGTSASGICWLPPTSPRENNLGHRLRNRRVLLRRDRVGTASTSNFTGQMILRSRDRGGTAFTGSSGFRVHRSAG